MKTSLGKYGFSQSVMKVVAPVVEGIDHQNSAALERKIAELSLNVINQIETASITPSVADQYFTLIDLYLTDNYRNLALTQEMKDLIFQGMILHDYGKEYGANLSTMR